MTYCTRCGTMNPINAAFCQKCGSRLESAQSTPQPQSASSTSTVNNYYYGRLKRRDRRRLSREGQGAPSTLAQKEVIKEIILIPCAYCGSLFPQTSTACPHCGAERKA